MGFSTHGINTAFQVTHTNALERQFRVVAIGKKNFLGAASESGAEAAAILYSLVNSCLLHDVDPFLYLSDVLRRVGEVKQNEVALLLPRNWKNHFLEDAKARYGPRSPQPMSSPTSP